MNGATYESDPARLKAFPFKKIRRRKESLHSVTELYLTALLGKTAMPETPSLECNIPRRQRLSFSDAPSQSPTPIIQIQTLTAPCLISFYCSLSLLLLLDISSPSEVSPGTPQSNSPTTSTTAISTTIRSFLFYVWLLIQMPFLFISFYSLLKASFCLVDKNINWISDFDVHS